MTPPQATPRRRQSTPEPLDEPDMEEDRTPRQRTSTPRQNSRVACPPEEPEPEQEQNYDEETQPSYISEAETHMKIRELKIAYRCEPKKIVEVYNISEQSRKHAGDPDYGPLVAYAEKYTCQK